MQRNIPAASAERRLIALCGLLYFVSYLTRVNYGAVLSELTVARSLTTAEAGLAVTGSFITYGGGQILCGVVGDRVRPHAMIALGLVLTACCNLLLPFMPTVFCMTAIWCINGLAQAMFWPPLVRLMAENLSPARFRSGTVVVSIAGSTGTIGVYLLAPLCIRLWSWRMVFWVCAGAAVAVLALWHWQFGRLQTGLALHGAAARPHAPVPAAPPARQPLPAGTAWLWQSGLCLLALSTVLQGMLKDGLLTLLPSYMAQSFSLPTASSVLITGLLPVFSICCVLATSRLAKRFQNEAACGALLFAAGGLGGVLLPLCAGLGPAVSLFFAALAVGGCTA